MDPKSFQKIALDSAAAENGEPDWSGVRQQSAFSTRRFTPECASVLLLLSQNEVAQCLSLSAWFGYDANLRAELGREVSLP